MNTPSQPRQRLPHRPSAAPRLWLLACALALPGQAAADAVTDWNATAGAVAPRFGGPQQQSRGMAIVQIAVHDALNAIDPRYQAYAIVSPAPSGASPEAAVATAARNTLLGLLETVPDSALKTAALATVGNAYSAALAAIPDGAAKTQGVAAGSGAATAILVLRNNDGSAMPNLPYLLAPGVGIHQPTPNPEFPAVSVPAMANWANLTPFAINSSTQFHVPSNQILNVGSRAYAREYNEVKYVGDALVRGAAPDSVESDVARFWPGGGANWNQTAREIVAGLGLDLWQHARLFALTNIAESDGHIANQRYKYIYNFWRPVTAIRWADDGNPRTVSDPAWRSFLVTPPYPDFPCALPTMAGAHASVLRSYFGTDEVAFIRTANAPALPLPAPLLALPPKTIVRGFHTLSEATADAAESRVFAGIHFRAGCPAGVKLGTQVGRFVFQHYLRPVKRHSQPHK